MNISAGQAKDSYLTFIVEGRKYAVNVQSVLHVSRIAKPDTLPDAPEYVFGVMNYAGNIIPVIDTAFKTGASKNVLPLRDNYTLIVFEIDTNGEKICYGAVVDKVDNVSEFLASDIKPVANTDITREYSSFVSGIITEESGSFIFVILPDKLFTLENFRSVDDLLPVSE